MCDTDPVCRKSIEHALYVNFTSFIEDGTVLIKYPAKEYYPDMDKLKRTFNDSLERVRWRSKQNLDYAFLMECSLDLSDYYLQLEDDVSASANYLSKIKEYMASIETDWTMLEFSALGFIGKLFHNRDLPKLSNLLRTFYNEQPCDFLILSYLNLMLQHKRYVRIPTLFQHRGLHSSLPNLIRNVSDHYFSNNAKVHHGDNPRAVIYTTLRTWRNFKPENAYLTSSNEVFWSMTPSVGDTYTIVFQEPQLIKRILVESGLNDDHTDKLVSGILEISDNVISGEQNESMPICAGYTFLGKFKNGKINIVLTDRTLKSSKYQCIKITITGKQTTWLVIREIAVFLVR